MNMNEKTKIIAFYLPQFHTFPENDKWWGKGFTEWTTVRNAKPLFEGHNQPRIPLHHNYYDLSDINNLIWQAELAKKYGIYGFCYYHYWFNGKLLMEKPAEMMLECKKIDFPFCMCWANDNWTRTWAQKNNEILIAQDYEEEEDWEKHFYYLLPFLKDERYIKINGKPFLIIYRPELIPTLRKMLELWKCLAKENGLTGLVFAYQYTHFDHRTHPNGDLFDYGIEYQPSLIRMKYNRSVSGVIRYFKNALWTKMKFHDPGHTVLRYDYDKVWKEIIKMHPRDEKMIAGAFVDWDNTPRHKYRGSVFTGVTPEKFEKYLYLQMQHAKKEYQMNMIFLFAWNEWGEGGYLEPDEKNGYGMLEAIQKALRKM